MAIREIKIKTMPTVYLKDGYHEEKKRQRNIANKQSEGPLHTAHGQYTLCRAIVEAPQKIKTEQLWAGLTAEGVSTSQPHLHVLLSTCSTECNSQALESAQVSIKNEQIKEIQHICITEFYTAIKMKVCHWLESRCIQSLSS